ncbi:MAG: hypothetical protein NZ483_09500 [Verrucomicrobiae bacterium]|nr:hypothetical protein [Verrucomicrobiae bacterium]
MKRAGAWVLAGLTALAVGELNGQSRTNAWSIGSLQTNQLVVVRWQPQFYVWPVAGPNGQVIYARSSDDFYDAGSTVVVQAVAAPYYSFREWTGQTNTTANPLVVVVERELSNLVAQFTPTVTSNGTPHLWYVAYGITNQFEWHDQHDADHDGYRGWEEYRWNTNPGNTDSRPRLMISVASTNSIASTNGLAVVLSIPGSSTGRVYRIERSEALPSVNWQPVTNAVGNNGTLSVTVLETNRARFYRATTQPE